MLWKIVVIISPRLSKHFVLIASPKISIKRSLFKNEPFPDTEEVFFKRYNYYNSLKCDAKKINANKTLETVKKAIHTELGIEN